MQNSYSLSVSVNHSNGEILSVYFQIRAGKSVKTKELAQGRMMADYNRQGKLLGVEMIAPCSAKVMASIDIEEPARAFIQNTVPRNFVRGRHSLTSVVGAG